MLALAIRPWETELIFRYFNEKNKNYVLCCSNIEAFEKSIQLNISNSHFIGSDLSEKQDELNFYIEADTKARIFDMENSYLRLKNNITDQNTVGWDYLNIYHIIYGILRTQNLAASLVHKIPSNEEIFLITYVNPPDYYFDNFVLRSIVINELIKNNNKIQTLRFNAPYYKADAYNGSVCIPAGSFNRISHLPTAFYDLASHKNRLAKFGNQNIDIESPYWDTAVTSNRITISKNNNITTPENSKKYFSDYSKLILDIFKPLVGDSNATFISEQLIKRSQLQIAFFNQLSQSKFLLNISDLDISDHEAGFHGPLLSLASERDWNVNIFPHSSLVQGPLPFTEKSTSNALLRRLSSHSNLNRYQCLTNKYITSNKIKKIDQINQARRVIIILNEFDDVAGIPHFNLIDLKEGLSSFIELLQKSGIEVAIRHKPSHSYKKILSINCTLADGQIEQWMEWSDLCIGIGEPSSLLHKFYLNGTFCIQVSSTLVLPGAKENIPNDVILFENEDYKDILLKIYNNFLSSR